MTVPNDIPAILARADDPTLDENLVQIVEVDVPNMAAEILSLRADKKRLDVLEEIMADASVYTVINDDADFCFYQHAHSSERYQSLTEAADAELSRREKEND